MFLVNRTQNDCARSSSNQSQSFKKFLSILHQDKNVIHIDKTNKLNRNKLKYINTITAVATMASIRTATIHRHSRLATMFILSIFVFSLLLTLNAQTGESASLKEGTKQRPSKDRGCFYMMKHYKNGQQIETEEPCLNCTCQNSMLMCYLRVCPYVRPIGNKCIMERVHGECCPQITCSDVSEPNEEYSNETLSSIFTQEIEGTSQEVDTTSSTTTTTTSTTTTTTSTTSTSAPSILEVEKSLTNPPNDAVFTEGCFLNNKHYMEGALMPSDPSRPCEICYCIRNSSACIMQDCALEVSGCSPVYQSNGCCPIRYNCSMNNAFTTHKPQVEVKVSTTKMPFWKNYFGTSTVDDLFSLSSTSTAPPMLQPDFSLISSSSMPRKMPPPGCRTSNSSKIYTDGEKVPSKNKCEHCYCMRTEIVCAVQECRPPCDGCTPIFDSNDDQCCPKRYECAAPVHNVSLDNVEDLTTTTLPSTTIVSVSPIGMTTTVISASKENTTIIDVIPSELPINPLVPMINDEKHALPVVEATESSVPIITASENSSFPNTERSSKQDLGYSSTSSFASPIPYTETQVFQTTPKMQSDSVDPVMTTRQTQSPLRAISPKLTSTDYEGPSYTIENQQINMTSRPQVDISGIIDGFAVHNDREQEIDTSNKSSSRVLAPEGSTFILSQTPSSQDIYSLDPSLTSTMSPAKEFSSVSSSSSEFEAASSTITPAVGINTDFDPEIDRKLKPTKRPNTIPGEGSCRYNGKIYSNGADVKPKDACMEVCMCVNSVVYCDEVDCPKGPENLEKCERVLSEGECCPKYICPEQRNITESTTISPPTTPASLSEVTEEVKLNETVSTSTSTSVSASTLATTPASTLASTLASTPASTLASTPASTLPSTLTSTSTSNLTSTVDSEVTTSSSITVSPISVTNEISSTPSILSTMAPDNELVPSPTQSTQEVKLDISALTVEPNNVTTISSIETLVPTITTNEPQINSSILSSNTSVLEISPSSNPEVNQVKSDNTPPSPTNISDYTTTSSLLTTESVTSEIPIVSSTQSTNSSEIDNSLGISTSMNAQETKSSDDTPAISSIVPDITTTISPSLDIPQTSAIPGITTSSSVSQTSSVSNEIFSSSSTTLAPKLDVTPASSDVPEVITTISPLSNTTPTPEISSVPPTNEPVINNTSESLNSLNAIEKSKDDGQSASFIEPENATTVSPSISITQTSAILELSTTQTSATPEISSVSSVPPTNTPANDNNFDSFKSLNAEEKSKDELVVSEFTTTTTPLISISQTSVTPEIITSSFIPSTNASEIDNSTNGSESLDRKEIKTNDKSSTSSIVPEAIATISPSSDIFQTTTNSENISNSSVSPTSFVNNEISSSGSTTLPSQENKLDMRPSTLASDFKTTSANPLSIIELTTISPVTSGVVVGHSISTTSQPEIESTFASSGEQPKEEVKTDVISSSPTIHPDNLETISTTSFPASITRNLVSNSSTLDSNQCKDVECPKNLQNLEKCQEVTSEKECCPKYVCPHQENITESITLAPTPTEHSSIPLTEVKISTEAPISTIINSGVRTTSLPSIIVPTTLITSETPASSSVPPSETEIYSSSVPPLVVEEDRLDGILSTTSTSSPSSSFFATNIVTTVSPTSANSLQVTTESSKISSAPRIDQPYNSENQILSGNKSDETLTKSSTPAEIPTTNNPLTSEAVMLVTEISSSSTMGSTSVPEIDSSSISPVPVAHEAKLDEIPSTNNNLNTFVSTTIAPIPETSEFLTSSSMPSTGLPMIELSSSSSPVTLSIQEKSNEIPSTTTMSSTEATTLYKTTATVLEEAKSSEIPSAAVFESMTTISPTIVQASMPSNKDLNSSSLTLASEEPKLGVTLPTSSIDSNIMTTIFSSTTEVSTSSSPILSMQEIKSDQIFSTSPTNSSTTIISSPTTATPQELITTVTLSTTPTYANQTETSPASSTQALQEVKSNELPQSVGSGIMSNVSTTDTVVLVNLSSSTPLPEELDSNKTPVSTTSPSIVTSLTTNVAKILVTTEIPIDFSEVLTNTPETQRLPNSSTILSDVKLNETPFNSQVSSQNIIPISSSTTEASFPMTTDISMNSSSSSASSSPEFAILLSNSTPPTIQESKSNDVYLSQAATTDATTTSSPQTTSGQISVTEILRNPSTSTNIAPYNGTFPNSANLAQETRVDHLVPNLNANPEVTTTSFSSTTEYSTPVTSEVPINSSVSSINSTQNETSSQKSSLTTHEVEVEEAPFVSTVVSVIATNPSSTAPIATDIPIGSSSTFSTSAPEIKTSSSKSNDLVTSEVKSYGESSSTTESVTSISTSTTISPKTENSSSDIHVNSSMSRTTSAPETEIVTTGATSEIDLPTTLGSILASSGLSSFLPTTTTASMESDYEEDTGCAYEGKTYNSAEQIPRSNPCDFCFCFRGDVICLQQTCPPPVPHCFETVIDSFCCPRYECPVNTLRSNTNSSSLSMMPLDSQKFAAQLADANSKPANRTTNVRGCFVDNKLYGVGKLIDSASGPCLECKCDRSGMMKCNPKECTPEDPLLQQINREVLQSTLNKSQRRRRRR